MIQIPNFIYGIDTAYFAILAAAVILTYVLSPSPRQQPNSDYNYKAGHGGEMKVASLLRKLKYEFLHDIVFKRKDGTTTQVDFVVKLRNGILVVLEVKTFAGAVYGDFNSRLWTHTNNKNVQRQFLNPIT